MTSIPKPLARVAGGRQQRGAHVELPRARHELRRDDDTVAHARVGGEQAADDALALAARRRPRPCRRGRHRPRCSPPRPRGWSTRSGTGRSRPCPTCPCRPRPMSPRRAAGWRRRCRRARPDLRPAVAGRHSLRRLDDVGPGQMLLDGRPPRRGMRQLRRVVRPGNDGQPAVRHLAGQLGRLIDQRVVVLAHDDRRRAGDGGELARREPSSSAASPMSSLPRPLTA